MQTMNIKQLTLVRLLFTAVVVMALTLAVGQYDISLYQAYVSSWALVLGVLFIDTLGISGNLSRDRLCVNGVSFAPLTNGLLVPIPVLRAYGRNFADDGYSTVTQYVRILSARSFPDYLNNRKLKLYNFDKLELDGNTVWVYDNGGYVQYLMRGPRETDPDSTTSKKVFT